MNYLSLIHRKASILETLLKRLSLEDVELFFTDDMFVEELENFVYYRAKALNNKQKIIMVDYREDLQEMLNSWPIIDGQVNETNFPIPQELIGRKQIIRTKIFHFNDGGEEEIDECSAMLNSEGVGSEYVIKQMNLEGYRPATLPELLAYGKKEFFLSTFFPIIALGSKGELYHDNYVDVLEEEISDPLLVSLREASVPMLVGEKNEPSIESALFDVNWRFNCRFLGVRI
jgi:hypothetical protein